MIIMQARRRGMVAYGYNIDYNRLCLINEANKLKRFVYEQVFAMLFYRDLQ